MKRRALCAALWLALPAAAHDPITTKITWTREIAPLLGRRCLSCHGEKAAVALATYEMARPWAKAIRDQVLTQAMPPWGAVQGFGEFRADPTLTEIERDTIVEWVEGGAPKGEDAGEPMPPPRATAALPVLTGHLLRVHDAYRLKGRMTLTGVRPEGLRPGGAMRVTAALPDGRTVPVLWVRSFPARPHDFVLENGLELPAGSVIHVECKPGQDAALGLVAENP